MILVTGAAGFVGGHLLDHLPRTTSIVGWTRSEVRSSESGVTWQRVNLLDGDHVRRTVAELKPTEVYHLAGATHVGQSWGRVVDTLSANILATHHLLDALRRAGAPCRLVLTGSAAVYAPSDVPIPESHRLAPASPYALSKLAQERLGARALAEDGVDVILTRPFNHTGPRQRPDFATPGMERQIALIERDAMPPVITVGNLDARRDLGDVRDTVRAYERLMAVGTPGTVYNVASGTAPAIREVLQGLLRRSTAKIRIEVDQALLRPNDPPVFVGDASRLREATGWRPEITFDRMLDDLLDYWRRQ